MLVFVTHLETYLQPCAERVLMVITQQYHQYVVPLLFSIFQEVVCGSLVSSVFHSVIHVDYPRTAKPVVDLDSILLREAVYCAIGRTCVRMRAVIPFDAWLASTLVPEAREANPQYPLIKRRIAWLVGKWMASDCASPNDPKVWELLVWLLKDRGPGTDAVVRLTAAVALKECLDVSGFGPLQK